MGYGERRTPNLAVRAMDLSKIALPNATWRINSGRELIYRFSISPSAVSRIYECELRVRPGKDAPEMFVLSPNLYELSDGKYPPHIYAHSGKGIKLCLWRPKYGEWKAAMKLSETYIPWTAEWLLYFENWLATGEWEGGGEHPPRHVRKQKNH
ncbi:hypothetical protein [Herbaspirillum sp. C7C8]|uniref:hypothetical protein n=1 Tax=Herbaspirillum sp. C7C8 TaxID=2736665 RepID=UPI001F518E61|nr:hypothetical protein [Herbaspirillum sp. C7C8]